MKFLFILLQESIGDEIIIGIASVAMLYLIRFVYYKVFPPPKPLTSDELKIREEKLKKHQEDNPINYQEEVLKTGLLIGFTSILILLITYIINFEITLEWWYGLLTLTVTIGLVIYLGINFRTNIGGYMSYKESFKFSFLVMTVSYVIGIIFNIVLYTVIDPGLPEVIKQITVEKTVEMMEGFGSSDEIIDATIEGVEKGIDDSTTPMGLIKSSPWGLLFLALLSLLTAAFIKKNKEISDRVN